MTHLDPVYITVGFRADNSSLCRNPNVDCVTDFEINRRLTAGNFCGSLFLPGGPVFADLKKKIKALSRYHAISSQLLYTDLKKATKAIGSITRAGPEGAAEIEPTKATAIIHGGLLYTWYGNFIYTR